MNNILHMFSQSIKANSLISFPELHLPAVDTRDIGRCAAALSLEESNKYHGRAFECSGPEILTMPKIAKTLTTVLGREIKYVPTNAVAFVEKFKPPPAISELLYYMEQTQENAVPFKPEDMEILLEEPPTGLEQWARDHAALFLSK